MPTSAYLNRFNTRSARRLILTATTVTSFAVLFGNPELIPTAAAQATVGPAAPVSPEARTVLLRSKREAVKQAPRLDARSAEEGSSTFNSDQGPGPGPG